MKGARLLVLILNDIALGLATIMVVLNLYPSWSQYAMTLEAPLLLATLSCISTSLIIRGFTFYDRRQNLFFFPFTKMEVRVGQLNIISGFLFIGVLCTPVTHPFWLIPILHLIFTPAAIITALLDVVFYNKTKLAYLGAGVAVVGFLLAYVHEVYSIGLGELIVAFIIAFNIWWHRRKIKQN